MKKPDFFIVGAPKCGTTALQQYLSEHPAVFMCHPKEPNFFTDFAYPRFRYVKTLSDYLDLFADADDSHRAVGEASASYLFIPEAISRLREFQPTARIIVMLREPAAMIQAWHAQLLYSREEDEQDLEVAWNLQDYRRQGKRIPRHCRDRRALLYRDVASYATQLEHVFSHFTRQQVLIILQEDFAVRTQEVYDRTLEFLGLLPGGRSHFPRVNVAKVANEGAFTRWMAQPPTAMVHAGRWLKKALRIRNRSLLASLRLQRAIKAPRPALDAHLRRAIAEQLRQETARLEEILGRDLRHWTEQDDGMEVSCETGPS